MNSPDPARQSQNFITTLTMRLNKLQPHSSICPQRSLGLEGGKCRLKKPEI
jgi:hypothetical protein